MQPRSFFMLELKLSFYLERQHPGPAASLRSNYRPNVVNSNVISLAGSAWASHIAQT